MRRSFFLLLFLMAAVLLSFHDSFALMNMSDFESESHTFAEKLANLLAGPIGLVIAFIGAVAAFFESKVVESRALIFGTIVITFAPFIIAMILKFVYL